MVIKGTMEPLSDGSLVDVNAGQMQSIDMKLLGIQIMTKSVVKQIEALHTEIEALRKKGK